MRCLSTRDIRVQLNSTEGPLDIRDGLIVKMGYCLRELLISKRAVLIP